RQTVPTEIAPDQKGESQQEVVAGRPSAFGPGRRNKKKGGGMARPVAVATPPSVPTYPQKNAVWSWFDDPAYKNPAPVPRPNSLDQVNEPLTGILNTAGPENILKLGVKIGDVPAAEGHREQYLPVQEQEPVMAETTTPTEEREFGSPDQTKKNQPGERSGRGKKRRMASIPMRIGTAEGTQRGVGSTDAGGWECVQYKPQA
ncbi:hypothetical protein BDM02DRAFT_3133140, partial [Thelephora ganbajun]